MQSEHKTQIYLSKTQHRALVRQAKREGRSMAAVVREAVAAYIARAPSSAWDGDPLCEIVGMAAGTRDASASIDETLYGAR